MSVVTSIIGWIETDRGHKVHNDTVLKELEYDEDFIKMFCSPEETGIKNPDYILFGASPNRLFFKPWLEKFEDVLKKMKAFGAFVFVDTESGGDRTFAIGYHMEDGEFIRHTIDFGDPCDYLLVNAGGNVILKFPLLFRILKALELKQRMRTCGKPETIHQKYVACDNCKITLAVYREGVDNCEQCGTPYIKLSNYIVAIEHKDFTQEFAVVPGRSLEDALKRLASDSPKVIRDSRRVIVSCVVAEFGELDVGLLGTTEGG